MRAAKRILDSSKSTRKNLGEIPDTEVSMKRRRRRFSNEFKLKILKKLDESTKLGQIGAVLRREGLYYSNITKWREQLEQGKLNKKLNDKKQKKILELFRQNRKLQRELNRSKLVIEVQKNFTDIRNGRTTLNYEDYTEMKNDLSTKAGTKKACNGFKKLDNLKGYKLEIYNV